jgi:uncharacterized membrane protein YhaH (DUF805 family)
MPFCSKCGTEIPEGVKFCSKCGNTMQATGELSLWEYYVKVVLKNYVNFKGRARRKEYWGFVLFNVIIMFALGILGGIIGEGGEFFGSVYTLAVFLPSLGAVIRRLHDIGKSGWLWLLAFIPIVGWIIVLIWLCTDSQPGENKYGPNPKGV